MMKKEGPKFNKDNYKIWKDKMKIYIIGLGAQYWKQVETTYVSPTTTPLTPDELREQQDNMQALEAIVSTLSDSKYIDVQGLETTGEV
ncbi:hypothetical protein SUGI_0498510 [Cryptomeria japonica]|nr:hypothetical protein SUGI_0498510 [Cryptomeria japonica]